MRIHQPIPETSGRVATPDGTVEVLPNQIVVMVSIAATRVIALPADAPRFPAVLDTGNNHNFAIRHEQLDPWTGLSLPKRGLVSVGGRTIPLHAASVWIHPGFGEPFRMRMEEGIVVYPPDVANPARAVFVRSCRSGRARLLPSQAGMARQEPRPPGTLKRKPL